jgi:hypothetical protein
MKVTKVDNRIKYFVEEGMLKFKLNGKEVMVSYYRKEDHDFGMGCDADHMIQGNNLTEDEIDFIEENWIDIRDNY